VALVALNTMYTISNIALFMCGGVEYIIIEINKLIEGAAAPDYTLGSSV